MVLGKISAKNNIIVTTHTILNPCLDVMTVNELKQIPNIVCNRNQARKSIQRRTICLIESDNDYILDKIKLRETIEYERKMSVDESYK